MGVTLGSVHRCSTYATVWGYVIEHACVRYQLLFHIASAARTLTIVLKRAVVDTREGWFK